MKNLNMTFRVPFIVFCIGISLALLVVSEPYLVNTLSVHINIELFDRNILKLFPYEITSLFLLLLLSLPVLFKLLCYVLSHTEKSFSLLYLFGLHTTALMSIGRIQFSELVLLSFLMIFLVKLSVSEEKILLTKLDLLNLLFIGAILLPSINSGPRALIDSLITSTKFLIIPFLVVNLITNREFFFFFIKWFIIITTVSSAIAILQEIVYVTLGIPIVGFIDKKLMRFLFEETSFGTFIRVPAFFGTYKPFSFFLVPAFLFILNYIIYKRPSSQKEWSILTVASLLILTALILTFSKDALLALIIGSILSLLIRWPYLIIHGTVCALLTVMAVVAFGVTDDINNVLSTDIHWGESRIRLQLAREGIKGVVYRHPWIGIGRLNASHYTSHFLGWSAHNNFIHAAEVSGIVGLLTYVMLIGYTFLNLFKMNLSVKASLERWTVRGMLVGFICLIVMYQFHPFFLEHYTWLYMSIVQAAVIIYDKMTPVYITASQPRVESG